MVYQVVVYKKNNSAYIDIYNNDELTQMIKDNEITSMYLCNDIDKIIDPIQCFELIKTNTSINSIFMSTKTNIKHYKLLCKALQINNFLQNISFEQEIMSSQICRWINKMLNVNTSLIGIQLLCRHIDDEGWSSLINALHVNKTVKEIRITVRSISLININKLVELVKVNNTLNTLILSSYYAFEDYKLLINALKNNPSIINCCVEDVDNYDLNSGVTNKIKKYTKRNKHNIRLKQMLIQDLD
jgi:hypothetical protein